MTRAITGISDVRTLVPGAAIAGLAALGLLAVSGEPSRAQDGAGCHYDYRSLTDDDLRWGKPPGIYCPYGYGPGMPYGPRAREPAAASRVYRERRVERARPRY